MMFVISDYVVYFAVAGNGSTYKGTTGGYCFWQMYLYSRSNLLSDHNLLPVVTIRKIMAFIATLLIWHAVVSLVHR